MTTLTTHVLDQVSGLPGRGIKIRLYRLDPEPLLLHETETNSDGRTDAPLLSDAASGSYQLLFSAGDYFRTQGVELAEPPFLDQVVIRFGLSSERDHYHVPLLLSPYGYSTYRGS